MIVIEMAGMPRAGKSACLEALESFLKHERKKSVRCIHEGIKFCPLDKSDPFLCTTWSFHSTANALMESLPMPFDYVLLDRGAYDHIAIASAHCRNGTIAPQHYDSMRDYFGSFGELEHLVLTFLTPPDVSLERQRKIHPYGGRVMNSFFLEKLFGAYVDLQESIPPTIPHDVINGEQPFEYVLELILHWLDIVEHPPWSLQDVDDFDDRLHSLGRRYALHENELSRHYLINQPCLLP